MNKKLILKIMLLLIFILAIAIILCISKKIDLKNFSKSFISDEKKYLYIDIEKFKPFNKGNIIEKYNTDFKISNNLPNIEAASAFYILGSYLVESIYNEEEYNDNLKLVSTSEAYIDLLDEKADFIIATKPSENQEELIKKSGKKLKFIKITDENLIFYTNIKNTVNNLNIEDIREIYTKNNSWKKYGYIDANICTYQIEKNNGSQTCFESIVKENKIDQNHKEIRYMEEIINSVGKDQYGIGYAFNSFYSIMYSSGNTKKISINGTNSKSSEYPLKYDVYLVYDEDNVKNENITKIEEWLDSEDGKKFVEFYENKTKT